MDSVTQFLLGAATAEAVAGKTAGNRAILWGGILGTIPDLDVLAVNFMDPVNALAFHRGFSHSLVFSLLAAPLFGWLLTKIYRNNPTTFRRWTMMAFVALFTHPVLDCFTTWGTQLFWPSDYRVAIHSIFVIDPLYPLPLLITLAWLVFLPKTSEKRRKLVKFGLTISTVYLLFTLVLKQQAGNVFEKSYQAQDIPVLRYQSRPSPLNTILWAVNLQTADSFYLGYYSFLDTKDEVDFTAVPINDSLLDEYRDSEKVKKLLEINQGWYTVERTKEGIILNDLRFGQGSGWEEGKGRFIFAYHIYKYNDEIRVKEIKRDLSEGKKMLKALWDRIKGK